MSPCSKSTAFGTFGAASQHVDTTIMTSAPVFEPSGHVMRFADRIVKDTPNGEAPMARGIAVAPVAPAEKKKKQVKNPAVKLDDTKVDAYESILAQYWDVHLAPALYDAREINAMGRLAGSVCAHIDFMDLRSASSSLAGSGFSLSRGLRAELGDARRARHSLLSFNQTTLIALASS
ncbi:hypothetical protein K438DRAFT_1952908 [Mycena galopus ATCC 62051]|nr:hypothetical protein K438DRAFT_1952908 [Mycena galopus ATCC 62051]